MKLALVTGGFKRIGAAISARLASEGWTLALHGRSEIEPEPDLAAILAVNRTPWHGFRADLADNNAVLMLLPQIAAHFAAPPTLIVNCASQFAYDDAESVTAESLATHFAVNAAAPILLATTLAKLLPGNERGCVINITDQRVRHPNGDQLSYTVSKQALSASTETLAKALAPKLRINAVAPGLTMPTEDYLPAQMVELESMMPLRRLPEPDEIADAVCWLAGNESVTGQTIFVDAGASLKSFDRDFLFLGSGGKDPARP